MCRSESVPVRGIRVRHRSGIAACPGVVSLQIRLHSAGRAEERWPTMSCPISGAGTDGGGWAEIMS